MAEPNTQNITVVMPTEQQQRAALAAEIKAMRKNPPDRAKVRGGAYTLADGRVVDANGKEIEEAKDAAADAGDESGDEGEESGDSTAPKTSGARKGAAKKGGR